MDEVQAPPPTHPERGFARFTRAFNKRLIYCCSLIAVSQINFGLDQAVFSNTQAMTPFNVQFGKYNPATETYLIEPYFLSLMNSLTYIGFGFGLITGSAISRRFGRRNCFYYMCSWALVGAVILVTAQTREQVLAGRVIANFYIGGELALVPVLQSELVPAQVRGFIVGTYQSGLLTGQLIGALICRGTSTIPSNSSWRIPFGLFFIIPSLLLVGVRWIPESPRWLLIKNRPDEALVNLRKLRIGKFSEEEIEQEFSHLQTTVNITVERGNFKELFQGTNLKRTLIVVGVNIFLQLTGQNFVSLYGTIFVKSLKVVNPFNINIINVSTSIVVVWFTQIMTDRTGRVPLMVAGAIVQTCALFTMGGLGTASSPSTSIRKGIVAMIPIFGCGFSLGWAPLSHVVAAEIPTGRLRDQTYAFGAVFNVVIQFAVSFSIPYLLNAPYANLGSKVGFIFGTTAFFATAFAWTCIPECKGKTLEQIDRLFLDEVPIRNFSKIEMQMEECNEGERTPDQIEKQVPRYVEKASLHLPSEKQRGESFD